jgi:hypothetical protein
VYHSLAAEEFDFTCVTPTTFSTIIHMNGSFSWNAGMEWSTDGVSSPRDECKRAYLVWGVFWQSSENERE